MARADLTTVARSGFVLAPTLTAATVDGDVVDTTARLWVHNGSGGSINVTVQTPGKVSGLDIAELVVPVPAGADRIIGPFKPSLFAQADDAAVGPNRVLIDYSAVTTVTRGAVAP